MDKGKLYICATPIGNLQDITIRVLDTLKEVDYIAAEDTRHTIKLLNFYNISKPLISYHEHNKAESGLKLIELLKNGSNIALVSDAGMPGISDPGSDLIEMACQNGIPATVLPGASAGVAALVLSGLPTDRYVFEGFLPTDNKLRAERLKKLIGEERTIILYEAPHRIISTLEDLINTLGDRKIAVVRELTKIHEEVIRTNLGRAVDHFKQNAPKGEFVIVLQGETKKEDIHSFDGITIEQHIKKYIEAGLDKKTAVKLVAQDRGIPKREVYKYSVNI